MTDQVNDVCFHCGKAMGAGTEGGYAKVHGRTVCHPNVPERADCYRLITVYKEPLGSRLSGTVGQLWLSGEDLAYLADALRAKVALYSGRSKDHPNRERYVRRLDLVEHAMFKRL